MTSRSSINTCRASSNKTWRTQNFVVWQQLYGFLFISVWKVAKIMPRSWCLKTEFKHLSILCNTKIFDHIKIDLNFYLRVWKLSFSGTFWLILRRLNSICVWSIHWRAGAYQVAAHGHFGVVNLAVNIHIWNTLSTDEEISDSINIIWTIRMHTLSVEHWGRSTRCIPVLLSFDWAEYSNDRSRQPNDVVAKKSD